jgi:type 2 lantibiotic biosynthesis protein LanM
LETLCHPALQSAAWSQAATLKERSVTLRSKLDRRNSVTDQNLGEHRLQRWRAQSPFAAGSYFAQRLEADGLSEQGLLYCLDEPAEALNGRLPSQGWPEQILRLFSRSASPAPLPLPEALRGRQTAGFLNLIEPLLRDALERVQEEAQQLANPQHMAQAGSRPHPVFDFEEVTALLFANLPQHLLAMLSRTMVLELNVARLEGQLVGETAEERFQSFLARLRRRDVALALLEEYPVLARQLVLRIEDWVNFSLEFLDHLSVDWESICTTFSPGGDPGVLVEVLGDAGDSHRGGRSVQIVKFSSGLQIVYKPRSLAVDVHFQELLTWLNERGDHPPFRTLKVLDRGSHGWTEFIESRSCRSEEEVRRFYERQGGYLALLYGMEAADIHFENLIAAGEHPILLDLEALFHPRVGGQNPREAHQLAGNMMNYSVLKVGLLPQRAWRDEKSAGIDVSGLASPAGQLTPFPVPHWLGEGTDEMRLARQRVEMPDGQNRPTLNGLEVDILAYTDAIEAGFTRMYRCLLKHQRDLLSDEGPLARFAQDEVRFIIRPTYVYGLLLRESFHPDVLRNALDRDRLFDRLWTAIEDAPLLAKIIPAEHQDLHRGDIPLFTTRPNSQDLWSSSHGRIVDFLDEPGLVRVRRRIQQLSDGDCARQLWFTRASLATLSKAGDQTRRRTYRPVEPAVAADRGRLLSAARKAGERLEDLALRGDRDVTWIGLVMVNAQDWALSPAGPDLYDGLPGIALFLAYLGEVLGEDRYTDLAQAALASVRSVRERAPAGATAIGGFGGWGGTIYALTHLSTLWRQPQLVAEAEAVVERLPALIERDRHFDMIGGAAGCISSLLALHHCAPSDRTLAAAVWCGDHLLAHAQRMPGGLGWISEGVAAEPLTGFSHGGAGIAWALLELAAATGDERFRAAGLAAIDYERSLFSAAEGNWPDLRNPEASRLNAGGVEASFATAWCHGAPGIGLGRLLCLRHLDDAQVRSEIDAALATTLARGFGYNHCLCHGDLGNIELLLQAGVKLEEPRWRAEAARVAAIVLESIDRNGWLCGNPLGVESPGLMTGLAGIGYALLRLAEPKRVPSVLALSPPRAIGRQVAVEAQRSAGGVLAVAAS